jgi:hypothetical protein
VSLPSLGAAEGLSRSDQIRVAVQGICPVMKKPLPRNPKWTVVDGRIVYVCCPPCAKKIEAQREQYLQAVDELYVAHLKTQQNRGQ